MFSRLGLLKATFKLKSGWPDPRNNRRTGRTYISTLIALAAESVRQRRPRFKIRPKVHQLHCEVILRVHQGQRFNPRYAACFKEEDYVGCMTKLCKNAVHSSSVSRRCLQRWLLQLNSFLAEDEEKSVADPRHSPPTRVGQVVKLQPWITTYL